MSKSNMNCLIAISLITPLPALADTSNVNIYGVANVSYDLINTGTSSAGIKGTTINKISSNASRLGFKGSQELGDDLTGK